MDKSKLDSLMRRYTEVHFYAIKRISALMTAELKDELTSDQCFVLRYICLNGPCTSSQLAERCNVNRSAITAMTNRLVAKQYIRRVTDATDRRVILLSATELGAKIVAQIEESIRNMILFYLQELEEQEIEQFIGIYEKIAGIIKRKSEDC
ncbi:MAG TPA: MarR family transcriptional regulator [Bacilli bacterium]